MQLHPSSCCVQSARAPGLTMLELDDVALLIPLDGPAPASCSSFRSSTLICRANFGGIFPGIVWA